VTLQAAQHYIVTEGDDAKAVYWLVRGAVAVTSRGGENTYAELRPGAFFGEIGILMNIPRSAGQQHYGAGGRDGSGSEGGNDRNPRRARQEEEVVLQVKALVDGGPQEAQERAGNSGLGTSRHQPHPGGKAKPVQGNPTGQKELLKPLSTEGRGQRHRQPSATQPRGSTRRDRLWQGRTVQSKKGTRRGRR